MFEDLMNDLIETQKRQKRDYLESTAPKLNLLNELAAILNFANQALSVVLIVAAWFQDWNWIYQLTAIGFIFELRHALHTSLCAAATCFEAYMKKQKDEIEKTRMTLGE